MIPHEETLFNLVAILLHKLETNIRPKPDWDDPDFSDCWLWTGKVQGKRGLKKRKRWRQISRLEHAIAEHVIIHNRPYPTLILGASRRIFVNRIMFMLYRQPRYPITRLKLACPSNNSLCVNPYHWVNTTIDGEQSLKPIPLAQGSALEGVFDFLRGRMADDRITHARNEAIRQRTEFDYIQRLKQSHNRDFIDIPQENTESGEAKGETKGETSEVQRSKPKMNWLVSKTGQPYEGALENYDMTTHYLSLLRKWVPDLSAVDFSDDLKATLEEFSGVLPKFEGGSPNDYWIARSEGGDGFSVTNDYLREGQDLHATELLRFDERTVHPRLILLKLDEFRKDEILRIDWTR